MLLSEEIIETIVKSIRAKQTGKNQYIGYCPVHNDKTPSLSLKYDNGKALFNCHAGCNYRDIISALGISYSPPTDKSKKILQLLSESRPLNSKRNCGYRYLNKRRIPIRFKGDEVYYHPKLPYYDNGSNTYHPGLLFRIRDSKSETIGIQRIYLDRNGNKASVDSPKKIMGSFRGGAIKFGKVNDEVHLTEGPETAIAIYKALKRPVWSCVSANNLSCQLIPKTVLKVHIWADKDKSETGQKEALKAADKYAWQGFDVYVHLPPTDISENSKSVDWLDEYTVNGKQIINDSRYTLNLPKVDTKVSAVSVDFSEKMIPKQLRGWCKEVSELMQVPLESVITPMIVALSSLIGRQIVVRPKEFDTTFEIVPNLWGAVIAPPGSKKTPTVEWALKPLYKLIDRAKKQYQEELNDFKQIEFELHLKLESLNHDYKSKKINAKDYAELKREIEEELDEKRPIETRYMVNDTTVEKLTVIHKDNPLGLFVYREELIGFFASLEKKGREEDRSLYLQSWSGSQPFEVDRISRGNLYLPHTCLSLFGNMVPSSMEKHLKEKLYKSGGNDGFLDRFQLLIYPEPIKNWKRVDRPPNLNEFNKVVKVFEYLDELDYETLKINKDNDESIPHIQFSTDAQDLYNKWITKHERKIISDNLDSHFKEHLSKYRSLMPSLAVIFHLIDQVSVDKCKVQSKIQKVSVQRAILWCKYLEGQLYKIYDLVSPDKKTSANALISKIDKGKVVNGNTVRDIYRNEWSLLNTKDKVLNAVNELSEQNIIRVDKIQNKGSESEIITIHPHFLKKRADTADTLIQ